MKFEMEMTQWPNDATDQAETLKAVEAALRMSYGRGMLGGMFVEAFIEAVRRKANEIDACARTHEEAP